MGARQWLVRNSRRVIEIATTDLLVWARATAPRPPLVRVALEIHQVGPGSDWRSVLPERRHQRVRGFLRRGDVGFIGTVEGAFVGEIWLSRVSHRDPWSGLVIRLAPDEAYAYALWIAEEYRPRGVGRALMARMLQTVADDPDLTRVYGWVDRTNRESQMLLRLLGFTDVQRVRRIQILHRRGLQLPRSAHPAFGPLSKRGRHSQGDLAQSAN